MLTATIGGPEYDPNTDPAKPQVGDVIPVSDLKVVKVEYIDSQTLMGQLLGKIPQPDKGEHDELLVFDHPTRQFVKYLVWADKISPV